MTYFTNVFVNAYDASDGTLYHYSLYSGETLREINEKIISIFEQNKDFRNSGAELGVRPKKVKPNRQSSLLTTIQNNIHVDIRLNISNILSKSSSIFC